MTNYEDIIPKNTNPQVVKMIPTLLRVLEEHKGTKNQVFSDEIINELLADDVYPVNRKGEAIADPKPYIAKAVQAIRIYHIIPCVMSTSKGYCIATTPEEYETFLRSMNERMKSSQMILQAAEDDMKASWPDYQSTYLIDDDDED